MPPLTSHQIIGIVYDADRNKLDGATVLLTHVSSKETLTATTNSSGEYMLNLKNLSTWSVGDEVTVKASKTGYGRKTETLIVSSAPADRQDIILDYTSDYITDTGNNQIKTNAAMLVDFENNKITPSNPLPVNNDQFDLINNPEVEWTYDSKHRVSTETVTIKGCSWRRTYTYTGNNIQADKRSKWIKVI